MASMMDSMGSGYAGYGFPFFSWDVVLIWLVIFFVLGYFVYQDANNRGMNGLLWWILVIIPMVGSIFLVIYIVIRESSSHKTGPEGSKAKDIMNERYAKSEITSDQFKTMSEHLKNTTQESIWDESDSLMAMNILNERYAKGELTSDQFKTMREEIKNIVEENIWEEADPESSEAMNILKERYAKGEITREQIRTMIDDLKK